MNLELPRYKLIAPLYADDRIIPEGAIIAFDGTPNEGMEPQNEAAFRRMAEFVATLGPAGKTPPVEEVMERAMRNRPREAVPLMGTTPIVGAAPPAAPKETVEVLVEDTQHPSQNPIRVMGTIKDERPTPAVGG